MGIIAAVTIVSVATPLTYSYTSSGSSYNRLNEAEEKGKLINKEIASLKTELKQAKLATKTSADTLMNLNERLNRSDKWINQIASTSADLAWLAYKVSHTMDNGQTNVCKASQLRTYPNYTISEFDCDSVIAQF